MPFKSSWSHFRWMARLSGRGSRQWPPSFGLGDPVANNMNPTLPTPKGQRPLASPLSPPSFERHRILPRCDQIQLVHKDASLSDVHLILTFPGIHCMFFLTIIFNLLTCAAAPRLAAFQPTPIPRLANAVQRRPTPSNAVQRRPTPSSSSSLISATRLTDSSSPAYSALIDPPRIDVTKRVPRCCRT